MRISGNKGEWSELYAFIRLLYLGKLYAADENVKKLDDIFFPILKILREDHSKKLIEYVIDSTTGDVDIIIEKEKVATISRDTLRQMSEELFSKILAGNNHAFEIDNAINMMELLNVTQISAASSDKTDITMQIHDINTGFNPICGFSIKSELGSAPTLLNASGATNFIYEVSGLTVEDVERINSINTSTKIIDRINAIYETGSLKFVKISNEKFSDNLMLIDSNMEKMIAELLLEYYKNSESHCKKLVEKIEEKNPLGYPSGKGFYEYKFKKFLCSVALGMMPSKSWNGKDEANGGYVIVKHDGDVVAYHIYNRNAFEEYLLNNTKFERGSSTRHNFGTLYIGEGNKIYINLNLQIRFI